MTWQETLKSGLHQRHNMNMLRCSHWWQIWYEFLAFAWPFYYVACVNQDICFRPCLVPVQLSPRPSQTIYTRRTARTTWPENDKLLCRQTHNPEWSVYTSWQHCFTQKSNNGQNLHPYNGSTETRRESSVPLAKIIVIPPVPSPY